MSDCSIVFVPLGIGTAAITPSRTANAKGRADALLLRGDMLLVALASALRTIAAADERGRGALCCSTPAPSGKHQRWGGPW